MSTVVDQYIDILWERIYTRFNMPKERRVRLGAHQPSAKLSKRQFAVPDIALEAVEIGATDRAESVRQIPGNDVLKALSAAPATVSKKGKQRLKHEVFIDRIQSSRTPYSKAQKRRFNRKQREQVGGGLGAIEAVISALEQEVTGTPTAETELDAATSQRRPRATAKPGTIGEGKGAPLTKAQRKRVLEMERLRHPLILMNPQYATNPFRTIRTHAQNTLEKHPGMPAI